MRRPSLNPIAGLYAIVDLPHRSGLDPVAVVDAMLAGGASVVQLRSKQTPLDPELVATLGQRCLAAGVPMILNDDLALAGRRIKGVAGLHLGQGDLSQLGEDIAGRRAARERLRDGDLILGVSTHDLQQLQQVIDELAPDYVGFGPVFSTGTKLDHDPIVGLDALASACSRASVPVVAIGGIDLSRAPAVRSAGAAAIAVIGALVDDSPDAIRARTFALVRAITP
jgi:thiamine-phosphate diphosphorylase